MFDRGGIVAQGLVEAEDVGAGADPGAGVERRRGPGGGAEEGRVGDVPPSSNATVMPATKESPAPTAERVSTLGALIRIAPSRLAITAPSMPRVTATISALPASTSAIAAAPTSAGPPSFRPTKAWNSLRLGLTRRSGVRPIVSVRPAPELSRTKGSALRRGDRADPGEDVGGAAGRDAAARNQAVEVGRADRGEAGLDFLAAQYAGRSG